MSSYYLIKHIHITLVYLTLTSFCIRFFWTLTRSEYIEHKLAKILPHIIDTALLAAGVYLMISLKFWPTQHPWLATKLLCLLLYIGFGTYALKRAKTYLYKVICGTIAIAIFIQMLFIAISHHPLGALSFF